MATIRVPNQVYTEKGEHRETDARRGAKRAKIYGFMTAIHIYVYGRTFGIYDFGRSARHNRKA